MVRELGDDLVLRRASAADADALDDFNTAVHAHAPEFEPAPYVGRWARQLVDGSHPRTRASDFLIVEDVAKRRIASSLCLLSHRFTYAGVDFGAGQPELVGTHPDYRRRGLVRIQMEEVHRWSERSGHLVQVIDGIPWYYRQFGYEMALDHDVARVAPRAHLPADPPTPAYRMREARVGDAGFVARLYAAGQRRCLVSCIRDEAFFRFELDGRDLSSVKTFRVHILETEEGGRAGFLTHVPPLVFGGKLFVGAVELTPDHRWSDLAPVVLHELRRIGDRLAAAQKEAFTAVSFSLGRIHPLFEASAERVPEGGPPYAYYVRVPDLPAFVSRVAPVLEARLAASAIATHTGMLSLSFYRSGLRLSFEGGKLCGAESWQPSTEERGDLAFPGLTFLQALFGFRTRAELAHAFPDARTTTPAAEPLFDTLFPKLPSDLWPTT